MSKRLGVGNYQYESVEPWPKIDIPGIVSDVATDSQDRVYLAVRTSHGLWITPEDALYLTDTFDHCVRTYSTSGDPRMVLGVPGEPGPGGCPFNRPTLAFPSPVSDDLFVSDGYRQNRVHRFSPSGADPSAAGQYSRWKRGWEHTDLEMTASWGSGDLNYHDDSSWGSTENHGTGPGEFLLPHGVVVDRNERVYVMDRSNSRIQIFDRDGVYLAEWATPSPNQGFIDDNDVMHVPGAGGIHLLGLNGEQIGRWGEKGSEPWQFRGGPHGLWIDSHSDIYVAQVSADNAINKFARV